MKNHYECECYVCKKTINDVHSIFIRYNKYYCPDCYVKALTHQQFNAFLKAANKLLEERTRQ